MELTQEQQDMLGGKYGKGTACIVKIQAMIDESFGAERMVPITRAHVALNSQEVDLWFAEKLLNAGARCRAAPTVNPGFCLSLFESRNIISPGYADLIQRTHNAYKGLGAVLSCNCTPCIDTNVPNYGEVIAFSESNATPYVNSVWGARTNREGANSALYAVVTGFVPEYGLPLDENRKGDVLIEVQTDTRNDHSCHMLGMVGNEVDNGIPVFTDLPKHISREALRNLGAELNIPGAYGMYHIVGFTSEAPTLGAAFSGKELERKVVITNKDLQEELKKISLEGNHQIDFAMFGCPHFALEEVKYIAERIEGKKLQEKIWVLTSSHVKKMAMRTGLDEIITKANGFIVLNTCPDQPYWGHPSSKVDITESSKCMYYPRRRGIHFVIRNLDTCIEATLTGKVK